MDYEITWDTAPEDVLVVTHGAATVEDLHAMTEALIADPRFRFDLRILVDHSDARWAELNEADVRRRAAILAANGDRMGTQTVAFVVDRLADFGIGRMLQLLTDGQTRLVTRIFFQRDEARAWLVAAAQ